MNRLKQIASAATGLALAASAAAQAAPTPYSVMAYDDVTGKVAIDVSTIVGPLVLGVIAIIAAGSAIFFIRMAWTYVKRFLPKAS